MSDNDEEFVDKCPTVKYPDCLACKNKEHTEEFHTKMKKREYMRSYMNSYNKDRVAYRRWAFTPKDDTEIFKGKMDE